MPVFAISGLNIYLPAVKLDALQSVIKTKGNRQVRYKYSLDHPPCKWNWHPHPHWSLQRRTFYNLKLGLPHETLWQG